MSGSGSAGSSTSGFRVTVQPAHNVRRGRRMNPTVEAVLTLQLDENGAPNFYDNQLMATAYLYDSNNEPVGNATSLSNPSTTPQTDFGGNGQGGSSSHAKMYFRFSQMKVNVQGTRLKLSIQVFDMRYTSAYVLVSEWTDEFNCA